LVGIAVGTPFTEARVVDAGGNDVDNADGGTNALRILKRRRSDVVYPELAQLR
jgi:hypothetical protein